MAVPFKLILKGIETHTLLFNLLELGRHPEALVVAERGRCRSLDAVADKPSSTLNHANLELHAAQR